MILGSSINMILSVEENKGINRTRKIFFSVTASMVGCLASDKNLVQIPFLPWIYTLSSLWSLKAIYNFLSFHGPQHTHCDGAERAL